jgi:hypothetical protein
MDHTTRAVLAQRQVAGAPEEVATLTELLEPLDLAGVAVTADALHTHAQAAEFLISGKQAHYLLVVKANRPTLLDRCRRLAWHRVPSAIAPATAATAASSCAPLKRSRSTTSGSHTPPRSSRSLAGPVTLPPTGGGASSSMRSPACRSSRPVPPAWPTCCAATGPSRRCTTSATPPSPRTPPGSAPAPPLPSWQPCATSPSARSVARGRSTSPPRCAATPATHADPWPPSGSASDKPTLRKDAGRWVEGARPGRLGERPTPGFPGGTLRDGCVGRSGRVTVIPRKAPRPGRRRGRCPRARCPDLSAIASSAR